MNLLFSKPWKTGKVFNSRFFIFHFLYHIDQISALMHFALKQSSEEKSCRQTIRFQIQMELKFY